MFRSKKKTYVGTSISRVIEDKNLPDSAKSAIIDSIFNRTDISGNIVDNIINGLSMKGSHFYEYGKKNLPYGLPTRNIYSDSRLSRDIINALKSVLGNDIEINYGFFGAPNFMHLSWEALSKKYNFDYKENTLEVRRPPLTNIYLYNMSLMVYKQDLVNNTYDPDCYTQWGRSPKAGYLPMNNRDIQDIYSSLILNDEIKSTSRPRYPYALVTEATKNEDTGKFNLKEVEMNIEELKNDKEYLHVQYTKNNKVFFWHYEMDSGVHPAIENVLNRYDTGEDFGLFFPFSYFRYEKKAPVENSEEYKATNNMLKRINMKYKEIIDSVHENPDINDVEQAMLIWAVNGATEKPIELKYLYLFFEALAGSIENSGLRTKDFRMNKAYQLLFEKGSSTGIAQQGRMEYAAYEIRDKKFRMLLSHNGIEEKYIGSSLMDVGQYSSRREKYYEYTSYLNDTDNTIIRTRVEKTKHIYIFQESQSVCKEVSVYGLETRYFVYGSHHTTGEDENDLLMIPLDQSFLKHFSSIEKEKLYGKSLKFVFNSRITQKVKWYQTGLFKTLITLASIVLVIYTAGGSLAALASGIAAGTVTLSAVFISLMKSILIGLVISKGVTILAKTIGAEITLILSVIIAAYGFYDFAKAGSFKDALWAEDLLKLSSGMQKGVNAHVSKEFNDLLNDYSFHLEEMDTAWEELREINDSLSGSNILTPFTFLGEKPDNYYNRTIGTGNIGVVSLESVSNFHKMALRLPESIDTLGE